jgi:DNA-binding transcriptional LysR family regulator
MSPELRHLRSFLAVAEERSFSAAARRLHVSQQALSRSVQQLERELGTVLFDRDARPIELTAAGEAMLASARRSIAAADQAFDAARRAEGGRHTPLRVDVSSGGIETGAAIVRRLRRTRPGLAIEQVEVGVRRGLRMLHTSELDALLGIVEIEDPSVQVELVRREPVLVAMAADHPLAACDEVPVARLAEVELLLPSDEAAGEWVRFVHDFCRSAGVHPRRRAGATHGSVSAAEVLREGGCVLRPRRGPSPSRGLRSGRSSIRSRCCRGRWPGGRRTTIPTSPRSWSARGRPRASAGGASFARSPACGCRARGRGR